MSSWSTWGAMRRLLVVAATVLVAVAVAVALLWPPTDVIAAHDVGLVTGSARAARLQSAREVVRTQLLTLGAGVFAAGALIFTARNFTLSRHSVELQRQTFELTEQGQVTDRYTRAIEQLGSDRLDVRIGGIYALESVARDSARNHPTVMEVLTAFIREHSHESWPPRESHADMPAQALRPDVQAAVTVVGRRYANRDVARIDLRGADLRWASLIGAELHSANLSNANMTGVDFGGADLGMADLRNANLTDSRLRANLTGAYLTGADLSGAKLSGAVLIGADLTDADLGAAKCGGLLRADLTGARLLRANLTDVDLIRATLTHADLTDALYPEGLLPDGWTRVPDSGRLQPTNDDPASEP
jgi:hypothetical protein